MRDGVGSMAPIPQALSQGSEALRGFFGEELAGLGRSQLIGIVKASTEEVALTGVQEVFKRDVVDLLDGRIQPAQAVQTLMGRDPQAETAPA